MTTTDLRGALRRDGDTCEVRFERPYPTTAADLWQAVTDPERLVRWLGRTTGELHPGGDYRVVMDDDPDTDAIATGTVVRCEPPHELELTWCFPGEAESQVLVEVRAAGTGSVLVLVHRALPETGVRGYSAGWHTYLDHLEADLTGTATTPWDERYTELLAGYALPWETA